MPTSYEWLILGLRPSLVNSASLYYKSTTRLDLFSLQNKHVKGLHQHQGPNVTCFLVYLSITIASRVFCSTLCGVDLIFVLYSADCRYGFDPHYAVLLLFSSCYVSFCCRDIWSRYAVCEGMARNKDER